VHAAREVRDGVLAPCRGMMASRAPVTRARLT
jgi:hypothetical protein